MFLIVEKSISNTSGICHAFYRHVKANNKCMKNPSYLKYWKVNNFYGWEVSQKLPANDFRWVKEPS